jgi:hypothetical protein
MRTRFGTRIIATGLIAAFGINLMTAATALAGPGGDRGRDRSYGRDDMRGQDSVRGRGQERQGKSYGKSYRESRKARTVQPKARHGGNRSGKWSKAHNGHRPKGRSAHGHGRPGGDRYRAQTKVIRKPGVVKKRVVVKRPARIHQSHKARKVHRNVVRNRAVYKTPAVRSGHGGKHRYGHGHGHKYGKRHYGPPPTRVIVVPPRRHYRKVWVVRDYGHRYYGYGRYHRDRDAYKWLSFTAITVALINNLTVYQQRAYEDAQIRATTAPVGQTIHWNEAGAYGTVTATREGTSSFNRYCREFQKTVTIGGRTEQAYGTACMQPDGAWEVVSNNGS